MTSRLPLPDFAGSTLRLCAHYRAATRTRTYARIFRYHCRLLRTAAHAFSHQCYTPPYASPRVLNWFSYKRVRSVLGIMDVPSLPRVMFTPGGCSRHLLPGTAPRIQPYQPRLVGGRVTPAFIFSLTMRWFMDDWLTTQYFVAIAPACLATHDALRSSLGRAALFHRPPPVMLFPRCGSIYACCTHAVRRMIFSGQPPFLGGATWRRISPVTLGILVDTPRALRLLLAEISRSCAPLSPTSITLHEDACGGVERPLPYAALA